MFFLMRYLLRRPLLYCSCCCCNSFKTIIWSITNPPFVTILASSWSSPVSDNCKNYFIHNLQLSNAAFFSFGLVQQLNLYNFFSFLHIVWTNWYFFPPHFSTAVIPFCPELFPFFKPLFVLSATSFIVGSKTLLLLISNSIYCVTFSSLWFPFSSPAKCSFHLIFITKLVSINVFHK